MEVQTFGSESAAPRRRVDAWREWLAGWSGALVEAQGSPAARRRLVRQLDSIAPALSPEQLAQVRETVRAVAGAWHRSDYEEIADSVRRLEHTLERTLV